MDEATRPGGRGYRSEVDGSQPYGLEIPDSVDFSKPVPLYIWLHGRGDNATDLHFIVERQGRKGQIQPAGAIVVHPLAGSVWASNLPVKLTSWMRSRPFSIDTRSIPIA